MVALVAGTSFCQYLFLRNYRRRIRVPASAKADDPKESGSHATELVDSGNTVDPSEDYEEEELFDDGPYPINDSYTMLNAPFKLLLCVNNELKMTKGKIAAQCGHATLGAYRLSTKYCQSALRTWEYTGQAKIAVKVEKEAEIYDLMMKAKDAGLVCYLVEDAGKTQIAAGSRTVLAIGPAPVELLDTITSHLKLL